MLLKDHSGCMWRMDWGWEWSYFGGREAIGMMWRRNDSALQQGSSGEKD